MKYLLVSIGSHGDVHPFVGIGQTLRRRGHMVALATNDHFRPLVERAGLRFLSLGDEQSFLTGLKDKRVWSRFGGFAAIARWIRPLHEKTYEVIKAEFRSDPETIVAGSSLAFGARVAQEVLGVRLATVHLSPCIFRSLIDPPKLPGMYMEPWFPQVVKEKMWEGGDKLLLDRIIGPTIEPLRQRHGLKPAGRYLKDWWNSPTLVLGMFPDYFGPAAADWPKQFRHAGFPLYDEKDVTPLGEDLLQFLASGDKPVAFTPGSAMIHGRSFFQTAVNSCKRLGMRGLLLTRHAEQVPSHLPPTVKHVSYAPFSELLPKCSAMVHHGGIGTTAQALRAGVPQLIQPMSHDQPDNARRLRRLGVGESIEPWLFRTPFVAPALKRLTTDRAVSAACAAVKAKAEAAADGLTRAAEILEATYC